MTIEDRFAALEAEVARLRAKVDEQNAPGARQLPPLGRTSDDFLDTMFGIHANSPDFEDVTRRMEEERESEREEARRLWQEDKGGM